jgi:hypothetical protein
MEQKRSALTGSQDSQDSIIEIEKHPVNPFRFGGYRNGAGIHIVNACLFCREGNAP